MDKRQKKLLVWVLTWAGLLLAVLYSPFGSPELYGPKQFNISNQGVAFNNISIAYTTKIDIKNNRKKYNGGGYSSSPENSLFDNNNGLSRKIFNNNSSGFSSTSNNNVVFPMSNFAQQDAASSSSSSIGGDLYSFSGKNTKNKNNSNQTVGLISITSDLSLLSDNNTTKQTATSGLDGTTDPGGDPTGDPIPVGDGWLLLLGLAAIYGIWKFKISRKLSHT